MTTTNRTGWTATENRPIYVRFDVSNVLRTAKNDGVTLRGCKAGYSTDETVPDPEGGALTLYDNYFGFVDGNIGDAFRPFKGVPRPLTNPLCLFQNDKGYWTVHEVPSAPEVIANVQDAKKPEPKPEWTGGKKGGGKFREQTEENLNQALAYTQYWFTEAALADREYALAIVSKVLGCASMIDFGAAPAEPVPVTDDDIPF